MEQQLLNANEINLEAIVANVVKIPGIRVNRDDFLNRMFRDDETNLPLVLEANRSWLFQRNPVDACE